MAIEQATYSFPAGVSIAIGIDWFSDQGEDPNIVDSIVAGLYRIGSLPEGEPSVMPTVMFSIVARSSLDKGWILSLTSDQSLILPPDYYMVKGQLGIGIETFTLQPVLFRITQALEVL